MTQTTKVTKNDLLIYPSERLTDTEDGGGLMIGTALTGAKNELFSPVSNMDRVNGAFNLRKIFPAVLRADDEPVYGSNFIIARPPVTPNWSFLAFKAISEAEERASAASRVGEYNIKTIESRMTLLSTQTAGSRIVQAYQRVDEPLPNVGEVFCLDQLKLGYPTAEQYFRVISVDSEIRTFTDSKGDFQKIVLTLEIGTKLDYRFVGVSYPKRGIADSPCLIRETHVADSASFYGVKKAKVNAVAGAKKIQVSDLFEKIVPTSSIETPLNNQKIGKNSGYVDAAKAGSEGIVSYGTSSMFEGGKTYYTGSPITPASLNISAGAVTFTDNNGKLLANSEEVGTVDYAGSFKLAGDSQAYGGYKTIRFRPAGGVGKVADTIAIPVDNTNRRLNYVVTVSPPPAPGSCIVSYRAQGNWYILSDAGSGTLSGTSIEHGTGTVNYATNTITLTLETPPDVDTSMMISWATQAQYFNRSAAVVAAPGESWQLDNPNAAPNAVTLTYPTSTGSATTTDDGSGNITNSDLSIKLNYTDSTLDLTYLSLPVGGAQYTIDYNWGASSSKEFQAPNRNADGTITLDLEATNITPRTLKMIWNVDIETFDPISTTPAELQFRNRIDPYITVFDDGNGNLKDAAGVVYGTIVYATGIITFTPDSTVKIPVADYNVRAIGVTDDGSGGTKTVYQNLFAGWNYIDAGVIMPIGLTGKVETWFRSATSSTVATQSFTVSSLKIDLTPRHGETIIAGSLVFELGGRRYYEQGGNLYHSLNPITGQGILAGTVNYATGVANVTAWTPGASAICNLVSLLTSMSKVALPSLSFRIPVAPVAPQSLQVIGSDMEGNTFDVTADASGKLTAANIDGTVDVETGVVNMRFGKRVTAAGNETEAWYDAGAVDADGKIWKPLGVFADTVKFNAVGNTYMPLDTSLLGIDSARLPSDGNVPIYRPGDAVVIASRWQQDLGSAFTAGQIVQLNQTGLTVLCLLDSNNKHVEALLYDYDLSAGTITFNDAIDPAAYALPLLAMYGKEEENKVTDTDIDGTLTLAFELSRAYDKANTFVSSALVGGNLQVRHTKPFSQQTWTNRWSNERTSNEILAKLDTRTYPMILTDDGTMTERWVIRFKSSTQFDLFGETLGLVTSTDMLQDLAPANPSTGKPYFTLPMQAFGDGSNSAWANGNCIRFNTFGTSMPLWLIRAVQPSSDVQIDDDGYALLFRADTVAL